MRQLASKIQMEEMVNSKFILGRSLLYQHRQQKAFKELLKKSMVGTFTLLDIVTMELWFELVQGCTMEQRRDLEKTHVYTQRLG